MKTIEVVAKEAGNKLKSEFEDLKNEKIEINDRKKSLESEIKIFNEKLQEYRKKSTLRILEAISWHTDRLTHTHLNQLLVHCINKLNGNIDGTELDLEFDFSIDEGTLRKVYDTTLINKQKEK